MKKKSVIDAGELRYKFSLYQKVLTTDELSGSVTVPTLIGTLWGSLRPAYAYESTRWAAQRMEVSHVLTVRAVPNLTISSTSHYLVLGARVFNVTGVVDVDEANRKLTIYCLETEGGSK